MSEVKKAQTVIRTTLTAAEWRKVKAAARRRDLSASQFVALIVREHLGLVKQ